MYRLARSINICPMCQTETANLPEVQQPYTTRVCDPWVTCPQLDTNKF